MTLYSVMHKLARWETYASHRDFITIFGPKKAMQHWENFKNRNNQSVIGFFATLDQSDSQKLINHITYQTFNT